MPARSKLAILVCLLGFGVISPAGPLNAADGDRYLVRLPLKSPKVLESLVERNIEILAVNRDGLLDVIADSRQLDYLLTLGFPVSVIHTPDMKDVAAELDDSLGLYHTYGEMESVLTDLETNYPDLADLDVMGTSIEDRNIYVLKISDNVLVSEGEAEVLIMGNHHAREIMTVDLSLRFAVYLLENYGIDPDVTDMVDNREIYIAPMINPDGHVYVEENHSGWWGNWWRKNRRDNGDGSIGVDLNRNYGYMWGYDNTGSSPNPSSDIYRGTGPFSEPETRAVRNYCQDHRISVALSYHSYGELLLFPWAYAPLYTPDHDVFLAMGDSLTSTNGYFAGNLAMGAIYPVNGDTDDWAYGETTEKDPFFCFTPEVNSYADGGFGPPDTLIQPTFDLLLPMNMLLLQLADNPHRVIPPVRPSLYAIDDSSPPVYVLNWSASAPSDPNPALSYEVLEYENLGPLVPDPANAISDLWVYNGFTLSTSRSFEGTGSYYSGAQDNSSHTMEMTTLYRVSAETDSFSTYMWYNIETHWDYAYLEVSADGGQTWETVPGNVTTNDDPNGNNRGNGITGPSPGWVLAVFPLTHYPGEELRVRFNYVMDASVLEEGLYVDLPGVPSFDAKTIVASGVQDTTLAVIPSEIGDFTYVVRARDAENQVSYWSRSQTITIIDLTAVGETPQLASRLGPNYPNPFNPVTRIPYTVGTENGDNRPVRVRLGIYNVAGQRLATVVDREQPPGAYEAVWNGRTDKGGVLPSGVYFARLSLAGREALTRKLVLLK